MSQKKKKPKKKLGPHNPQKNKPAKNKNDKKLSFGPKPTVAKMTFNQPNRVDISIFINGGRVGHKGKQGHKGSLRRG